jgi:putative two-component system response regulator
MNHQSLIDYEKETGISQKDPLTSTYNHGVFLILLEQEVERFKRYGKPFGLLLIDIDWFSFFNRRFGPIEGDRVLKSISEIILKKVRSVDTVSRYIGDRFSVILPETSDAGAVEVAERIQRSIVRPIEKSITVSIGISICPHDGKDKSNLLVAATDALQEAKKLGKNRIYIKKRSAVVSSEDKPTILVVDDDLLNQKLMTGILKKGGYTILTASNGREALHSCQKFDIDLVLLDVMMPVMDGFETCRRLKMQDKTRLIPIIMITALNDANTKIRGIEAGADDFLSRPPNQAELLARTRSLINVKQLNKNLTSVENVLFSMARAVEAKDKYTQGHIERVANLAVSIGRNLTLTAMETKALHYGGILHDMGKIGIPHEILNKPGPLSKVEWEVMKQHPEIGYKICLPLGDTLGAALDVIRYHHEKMDGSGYPYGLKGEEIPTVARIMAAADIYDALVTDRPYRRGMTQKNAIEIMATETAEGKLDKDITQVLVELLTIKN